MFIRFVLPGFLQPFWYKLHLQNWLERFKHTLLVHLNFIYARFSTLKSCWVHCRTPPDSEVRVQKFKTVFCKILAFFVIVWRIIVVIFDLIWCIIKFADIINIYFFVHARSTIAFLINMCGTVLTYSSLIASWIFFELLIKSNTGSFIALSHGLEIIYFTSFIFYYQFISSEKCG